jgi:N-sulfoglucosamine sulfohydrolase
MRILTALLTLFACLAGYAPASAGETPRKNVVLLVADDLGLDLGCYGNKVIRTPNLDALAKNGVRFTNGFATVSSCSPSRASIYTGLVTHTSGQYGLAHAEHNQHTFATVQSLPGLLRGSGYRSGIIGKVHVLPPSVYSFDAVITKDLSGNRDVTAIAKQALQFIRESKDKPFLLVVGFGDPHRAGKGFANDKAYPGVPEVRYNPKDVKLPYFLPDQPEVREEIAEYYQSVSRLDHGVGLILDVLRKTGQLGNTLIIFLSDNGIPFPGAKTTLYDSGLHLPLIISSPAQKKHGHSNDGLVSWIDITPTILDWAKVKSGPKLPGKSLLPILDEEHPKGWDVVFGSHQFHEITMYYPMRMIRTRKYQYLLNLAYKLDYPFASDLYNSKTWQGMLKRKDKLLGQRSVESYVHRPREELYDLEKDPNELQNLANDPKYADVLKDLRKRLRTWQEQTRDPWLVKYRYE